MPRTLQGVHMGGRKAGRGAQPRAPSLLTTVWGGLGLGSEEAGAHRSLKLAWAPQRRPLFPRSALGTPVVSVSRLPASRHMVVRSRSGLCLPRCHSLGASPARGLEPDPLKIGRSPPTPRKPPVCTPTAGGGAVGEGLQSSQRENGALNTGPGDARTASLMIRSQPSTEGGWPLGSHTSTWGRPLETPPCSQVSGTGGRRDECPNGDHPFCPEPPVGAGAGPGQWECWGTAPALERRYSHPLLWFC